MTDSVVGFNEHCNALHFIRSEGFSDHLSICQLFKKRPCPLELLREPWMECDIRLEIRVPQYEFVNCEFGVGVWWFV